MTPKEEKFLKIIQTSGNSLLGTINNILDFSKIEAGKLKLEKTVSGPNVMLKIRNKTKDMLEGITIRDSVPKRAFIRSRMIPGIKSLNATTDVLTWEILKLNPDEEVIIQYSAKITNKGFSAMVNGKEQKA